MLLSVLYCQQVSKFGTERLDAYDNTGLRVKERRTPPGHVFNCLSPYPSLAISKQIPGTGQPCPVKDREVLEESLKGINGSDDLGAATYIAIIFTTQDIKSERLNISGKYNVPDKYWLFGFV